MGASNSVPRTASFDNPRPAAAPQIGIHVTENVVNRLENVRKYGTSTTPMEAMEPEKVSSASATATDIPMPTPTAAQSTSSSQAAVPIATLNTVCKNCEIKKHIEKNGEHNPKKIDEVHQVQFDQALEKIEKVFSKPEPLNAEIAQDIKLQQKQLIECYKSEEKRETFECEKLAKQFQKFVYEKQYNTMKPQAAAK